jgi:hypothetical protein
MLERISFQPILLFRFVQHANMQHTVGLEKFRIRLLRVDVQAEYLLVAIPQLGNELPDILPGCYHGFRIADDADIWLFSAENDEGHDVRREPGSIDWKGRPWHAWSPLLSQGSHRWRG